MGINLSLVKEHIERKQLKINWFNLIAVLSIAVIGFVGAPLYLVFSDFSWWHALALFCSYWLAGLGITMGYHRLYSHRAFDASFLVQIPLVIGGSMAFQNSVLSWSSDHRRHHNFVDTDKDPYNAKLGFWWSHMLWIFYTPKNPAPEEEVLKNVKDLQRNPLLRWQHKYNLLIGTVGNVILCLSLGLVFNDIIGFFLIVGFFRMALLHQSTFFINSFAHIFGHSTHSEAHTAKDSFLCSILALGEGYHNYHHTYPNDYRNGVKKYNFDPTKWIIWTLSKLGLTWNLKRTN